MAKVTPEPIKDGDILYQFRKRDIKTDKQAPVCRLMADGTTWINPQATPEELREAVTELMTHVRRLGYGIVMDS